MTIIRRVVRWLYKRPVWAGNHYDTPDYRQFAEWEDWFHVALAIVQVNNLEEWVNLVRNNYPVIIGEDSQWYPSQILNSIPHCLFKIQTTLPQSLLPHTSGSRPIQLITMCRVTENSKSVINEETYGTNLKLVILWQTDNADLNHENLNTIILKCNT